MSEILDAAELLSSPPRIKRLLKSSVDFFEENLLPVPCAEAGADSMIWITAKMTSEGRSVLI
jgi:hypothetical protein